MFTFLTMAGYFLVYLLGAGITHGYAKYRWPENHGYSEFYGAWKDLNGPFRFWSTVFWPFYWTFIWTFTKSNELIFEYFGKSAAKQIAKNKSRISDVRATRSALEASNVELETAEIELEKEIAKTL